MSSNQTVPKKLLIYIKVIDTLKNVIIVIIIL